MSVAVYADLRAVDRPVPDLEAAERAAAALLHALGISTAGDALRDTPRRMARAYAEMFTPTPFEATTFPNEEGYDELVLVRDIPFRSVCEHHLLPFTGTACVGYLPGDRILGLSSWPGWSTTSRAGRRCRNGSPSRWPTGSPSICSRVPSGGDPRRAHLHDVARCAGQRVHDRHLDPVGRAANRCMFAPGVLRPGRHRRHPLAGESPCQTLRMTVTTLPSTTASLPGIGSKTGLCGISQT